MLLHSCVYYDFGTSIVSDADFDKWAYELVELQREHPEEAAKVDFAAEFKGWDGSTGFDLPRSRHIKGKAFDAIRRFRGGQG